MLEFKKRELEFNFEGEAYRMKFPTVKQTSDYAKNHDKAEDKLEEVIKFLEVLGLKREVSENMEVPHLEAVIGALTEAKK
jgi:hypothetical protein